MKQIFLSSSFSDVESLFVSFSKDRNKGQTITFIPTASLREEVKFYVEEGKKSLKNSGFIIDELDISTATKDEISTKLRCNDAIYVCGGNTFFLLQELIRTGTDKLIKNHINAGKLYIGESAGSVILSPNIEYIKDMDDIKAAPNLHSFSALSEVEFYPLPHYTNFPFEKVVDKIISDYTDKINLCPISNAQAITLVGDKLEVLDK
ncbi:peptidase S51 [Plesiomonas shigelloides]|uniref:Type 1 glutamine amidotransferase-like domain-containing protein n=1 Tax=Plesiomonas shigelloides TaxID=703 RepID=UPI00126238F3|nr:Type 1 glutamine amidotransferase-like domain-containing protein [Plesiomonas shigelloides]KAB7701487.1 peptidase S51 [Plesiomonas shigelloides]